MQVLLEIPNIKDWQSLAPIVKRLGIFFTIQSESQIVKNNKNTLILQQQKDWEIIMRGVKKSDFDVFVNDFEESRKDRVLER